MSNWYWIRQPRAFDYVSEEKRVERKHRRKFEELPTTCVATNWFCSLLRSFRPVVISFYLFFLIIHKIGFDWDWIEWIAVKYNIIFSFRGQSWLWDTKCACKSCWLWFRSLLQEMRYLFKFIFSFLVETKSDVEFRHSTRNAFRIRRKVGNGVS